MVNISAPRRDSKSRGGVFHRALALDNCRDMRRLPPLNIKYLFRRTACVAAAEGYCTWTGRQDLLIMLPPGPAGGEEIRQHPLHREDWLLEVSIGPGAPDALRERLTRSLFREKTEEAGDRDRDYARESDEVHVKEKICTPAAYPLRQKAGGISHQ